MSKASIDSKKIIFTNVNELCNVKEYKNPVPYKHPKGAVIWVKKEIER